MSTEIFAMVEVRRLIYEEEFWCDAGEIEIEQNYGYFAALGNVRNYDNIPSIGENRIIQDADGKLAAMAIDGRISPSALPCRQFSLMLQHIWSDAFGASYATLAEIEGYDLEYTYDCRRKVMSRNTAGKITGVLHKIPKDRTYEAVGVVKVFGVFENGRQNWRNLAAKIRRIAEAHGVANPADVRLAFFFY